MKESINRYSTPFRQKVVRELEMGKLKTLSVACDLYGIASYSAVSYWIKRFGSKDKFYRVVRTETVEEKNKTTGESAGGYEIGPGNGGIVF